METLILRNMLQNCNIKRGVLLFCVLLKGKKLLYYFFRTIHNRASSKEECVICNPDHGYWFSNLHIKKPSSFSDVGNLFLYNSYRLLMVTMGLMCIPNGNKNAGFSF